MLCATTEVGNRSTGYPNTVRSYLGDDATRQMWHRCNKYHELQSSHRLNMIRILNRFCVMNICICIYIYTLMNKTPWIGFNVKQRSLALEMTHNYPEEMVLFDIPHLDLL